MAFSERDTDPEALQFFVVAPNPANNLYTVIIKKVEHWILRSSGDSWAKADVKVLFPGLICVSTIHCYCWDTFHWWRLKETWGEQGLLTARDFSDMWYLRDLNAGEKLLKSDLCIKLEWHSQMPPS